MKNCYLLLIALCTAFTAQSQIPTVLKDINPSGTGSNLDAFIKMGNIVFFKADDGIHGNELWKTDGTAGGTILVKDIKPGASGSDIQSSKANVNGTLYFSADDGINGVELWKSDGTEAGTVLVKDIDPGSSGSYPSPDNSGVAANGLFYFRARSGVMGYELWKSDGTAAGTVMVKDINPTSVFSDSNPSLFTYINGTLFFTAFDGTHGTELWKSDGTGAGTVMVKDIKPLAGSGVSSVRAGLTNFNNTLYFAADEGINGVELWMSDGTEAGTIMVKDIVPGFGSGSPYGLTVVGNTLYFSSTQLITDSELWKTDGTAAGTVLVKDINNSGSMGFGLAPFNFTLVDNDIFFVAVDAFQNSVLWKTDGTAAGTVSIKSWPSQSFQSNSLLTNLDGTLYFRASNSPLPFEAELWKSDGTGAGTVSFDLYPGDQGANPGNLTVVNNQLLFAADDLLLGRELWSISNVVLPLKLLNFSARKIGSKTALSWQTAAEINTALFEIERAANSDFKKIGEVAAMNRVGQHNYSMYDEQPLQGSNFYRLKMIDIDGSFAYSSIARLDFNSIDQIQLSPNPVSNELMIKNVGAYNLLQVIDASGRVVHQQKISGNIVTANIQTLVGGNYVLRLTGKNAQQSLQFVKQ